jgi:hypothetical protein
MAHRVPAGALAAIAVASLAGCAAEKGVAGPPPPT